MSRKLFSALFLLVSLSFVLVRTVRSQNVQAQAFTASQEKEEEDPHSRVQVKLDLLILHDGLPGGAGGGGSFAVGGNIGKATTARKDSSGKVIVRTIEGQSRWLPDNAIEITLDITENDVKRTETILLEGFEPKTLVLSEDPAHGRRELLRLIPVFGPNPCS